MFTVRLVHRSSLISFADLRAFSSVLHEYVNNSFAFYWGINASVYVTGNDTAWSDKDFRVVVHDDPEDVSQAQILGQHVWRGQGCPEGYIFARLCEAWKTPWTEILSHEVIEMLVDPWLSRYVRRGDEFWPVEVCDPVQGGTFDLGGYKLANFVTPSYYRDGAKGPFDLLETLKAPFTVAEGGFGQVYRNGSLVPLYGGKSDVPATSPRNSGDWSREISRRSVHA